MASMKAVVIMVAVPALMLALSATVSARPDAHVLDLFDLLSAQNHVSNNYVHVKNNGNSVACCDACYCTKRQPAKCRCADIFSDTTRCVGCDKCVCARSIPPQCWCYDVTDSCSAKCSDVAAPNSILKNIVTPN